MIAKFNGTCSICGLPILKGEEMNYEDKKATHPNCSAKPDSRGLDEQQALADALGYRHA